VWLHHKCPYPKSSEQRSAIATLMISSHSAVSEGPLSQRSPLGFYHPQMVKVLTANMHPAPSAHDAAMVRYISEAEQSSFRHLA